jgi:transcriptional regulator with XRE-family HTH domain
MRKTSPHNIDILIGQKLRYRRMQLNITQEQLGKIVGLTFQQIQKYEKGANRISASRLAELAKALDVPLTYFFEDLDIGSKSTGEFKDIYEKISRTEIYHLISSFSKIQSPKTRKNILEVIEALGKTNSPS